ncbi:MAG TPA: YceI family protein [Candidatus Deferrimicrobium sp.]|nr:YceI family protein [Candidatus Deferrimicrobium sp.]
MRKRLAGALVVMMSLATVGRAEKWEIDKTHSAVGFNVRHMVVAKVPGYFRDFVGFINFDGQNLETGIVEFTVQMASIDTDNENRDEHLRSADFFDAAKFPSAVFKSRKVIKGEGSSFKLVGDLTMKDVTKEVVFECEFNGVVTDPWGNTRAGFSAQTKINRQDFNVTYSKKLDTGGLIVGDDVNIMLDIEAVKAKS